MMQKNIKAKRIYQLLFLLVILLGCNQLYKAGNLISLGYPVETKLKTEIVRRYVDTLIQHKGYAVPSKWLQFDKLIDLDSNYNKRLYFNTNPEEMYLISYGGMLVLSDVYNPGLNDADWVSERNKMPVEEEKRVKARFKKEILDVIESMAKRDGLADSTIYVE